MPTRDDAQSAKRDRIFISYRRDDTRGASGRLYDWLRIGFGRERVFRDVHSIGVGKWRDKIDAALARSVVCVVVIGPRWANVDNLLRLHDENDMVRYEIVTALGGDGLAIVPTLVEGAKIPEAADLPAVLQPLVAVWNARKVTEDGWEDDTRRLVAEISAESGLTIEPQFDAWLRDAGAVQTWVAEQEQLLHLQSEQIDRLRDTVDELTRQLAEATPAERPARAAAFAALAHGDSLAAEDLFEREYDVQSHAFDEGRQRMAEAARNVANLAFFRDITKAVSFYRKALDVDPEHAETAWLLGLALMLVGDLTGARDAFSRSLIAAIKQGDKSGERAALNGLGDVMVAEGDGPGALATFSLGLASGKALAVRDPASTDCIRGLWVSENKIGDVLVAQGDSLEAMEAYRRGLAIAKELAARDPANTEWQRDLSVSHERIGDILVAQGNRPRALRAYRQALAIAEALAARDPADTRWQRDLFVSEIKIGDVLLAQGNGPAALEAYRRGLAIAEALTKRDPANTLWQRDLSVSHELIGDVLAAQGDGLIALASYGWGRAIRKKLVAHDPANTQWQRDLSLSENKIGETLRAQGNESGALGAYRRALALAETLAARDPANTLWQSDLSVSHDRIGDVLLAQGDGSGALDAYVRGQVTREALAAHDPANSDWQRDLSVSFEKIGNALAAQGNGPSALTAYRRNLAISEALAARDPTNIEWQTDVVASYAKLGTLDHGQSRKARRQYLRRGKEILIKLKSAGRLMANRDWIAWFDKRLASLR